MNKDIELMLAVRGIKYPRCGFDIEPGWYPHVVAALDGMIAAGWDKELAQVKQKFGGLRIYIGKGSDDIYRIIRETETLCDALCEECGAPHGLKVPLSGMALCDPCMLAENERAAANLAAWRAKQKI